MHVSLQLSGEVAKKVYEPKKNIFCPKKEVIFRGDDAPSGSDIICEPLLRIVCTYYVRYTFR